MPQQQGWGTHLPQCAEAGKSEIPGSDRRNNYPTRAKFGPKIIDLKKGGRIVVQSTGCARGVEVVGFVPVVGRVGRMGNLCKKFVYVFY